VDLDIHLDAIAAGDSSAFAAWIAGGERPLRESLRSFAARVDVEAVLQEALLRVWQVAPRAERDGKPNTLLRMALRIARNLALDEVRRARTVALGDDDPMALVEVAFPDVTLRRTIADCREKLPQKQREVLDARIVAAEPDAVLAARLRMRLNTFLQNFTRARKLLADCLRARGIEIGAHA